MIIVSIKNTIHW